MPAPHPPLKEYYAQDADRGGWLKLLFDRTAGDYDRVERLMAFGSGSWYRRRALALAGLGIGMRVLDVGIGTGLTARAACRLVGRAGRVTGIDPSAGMMARAIVPAGVDLMLGSAEALPAASGSSDFVSMGYALRHVADFTVAFREFHRVLVPGGRLCLLEITPPRRRLPRVLLRAYMRSIVPGLARCVAAHRDTPKLMRYYWDTIEHCAAPVAILSAIAEAGFTDVHRSVSLGIFSAYCARKPTVA